MVTKTQMLEAIRSLPDDATVEDALYRLELLAKIDRGIAQIEAGQGIPHAEAKRRIAQWLE